MRASLRAQSHYVLLVPLAIASLFLTQSPPVPANNVWWGRTIVANTPQQIWLSSHFGQVLDFIVLQAGRLSDLTFTAHDAMSIVSYANGVVYIAALVVLGIGQGRGAQVRLMIAGMVSPITVYLRGDEEMGAYPFPLLILVAGLALVWRERLRIYHVVTDLLAGVAAAAHGSGLFFLPGIVALRWAAERPRHPERLTLGLRLLDTSAIFFAPAGALLIAYVLIFRTTAIVGGDATGGSWGTLLLPLVGTLHASRPEFQDYTFWSIQHAEDVLTMLGFGAPAFLSLVGLVSLGLRRRDRGLIASIRMDWAVWTLGVMGLVLTVWMYPAGGMMLQAFILVPALSILQTLALRLLVAGHGARAWLWPFLPLLAVSAAASAFLWYRWAENLL